MNQKERLEKIAKGMELFDSNEYGAYYQASSADDRAERAPLVQDLMTIALQHTKVFKSPQEGLYPNSLSLTTKASHISGAEVMDAFRKQLARVGKNFYYSERQLQPLAELIAKELTFEADGASFEYSPKMNGASNKEVTEWLSEVTHDIFSSLIRRAYWGAEPITYRNSIAAAPAMYALYPKLKYFIG